MRLDSGQILRWKKRFVPLQSMQVKLELADKRRFVRLSTTSIRRSKISFQPRTNRQFFIDFSYERLPTKRDTLRTDDFFCNLEGEIQVSLRDDQVFRCNGVLLLELAAELTRWLNSLRLGPVKEFYYESMNMEEQPILRFRPLKDREWLVDSIFNEGSEFLANEDELVAGANSFIHNLKTSVLEKCGYDIRGAYGVDRVMIT